MPFTIITKPVKIQTLRQKNFHFLYNNEIIKGSSQQKKDCGGYLVKLALTLLAIYSTKSKMSKDRILEKIIKWIYFGKSDQSLENLFLPQHKNNNIPVWYTGFNHSESIRKKLSEEVRKLHGYTDMETKLFSKISPRFLDKFDEKCGGLLRLNRPFWNGYSQMYTYAAMNQIKKLIKQEMKNIIVFVGIEPDNMDTSYFFKEELKIIEQMNKEKIPVYMFNTKKNCKDMVPAIKEKYPNIEFECIDCKGLDECLLKSSIHFKFKKD
jgi:hypothetical protein